MVIAGTRARQDRQGAARARREGPRRHRAAQHGEAAHEAARRAAARAASSRRRPRSTSRTCMLMCDRCNKPARIGHAAARGRHAACASAAAAASRLDQAERWPRACASATRSEVAARAHAGDRATRTCCQVPRLEKIVLNMGLGEAIQNAEGDRLGGRGADGDHRAEAGRHASQEGDRELQAAREACRSACMVTLRGERMYEFFDRLVNVALPRVRDFKGVSDRSFDGRGNYSLGLREQIIFPGDRPRQDRQGQGPDDRRSARRPGPTPRARRCCARSACPFRA